jgi:hypothetical protein
MKRMSAVVILLLSFTSTGYGSRLLYLSFEEGVSAGRELPGAHYVQGKHGRAIVAAEGEKGALILPASGNLDLARGTICFWVRPLELLMPLPSREETNLVVLDRSGEHVADNPSKVAGKIFNTFIAQPGSVRLRGETFDTEGGYYGTLFEYIRLYPKWYHFAWTWDSETGKVRQYLNARLDISHDAEPWTPQAADGVLIVGNRYAALDDVAIYDRVLSQEEIATLAGVEAGEGLTDEGVIHYDEQVDLDTLRGDILFSCDFDSPDDISDWVMEGPGEAEIRDGRLFVRSNQPQGGHIVFWNPMDFPDDLLIEYDFSPASEEGLCILFFCASGSKGRDLFDPTLAPRTGRFSQYVRGDIKCYHTSYYRNQRTVSSVCNLRKDPGMPLLGVGADPIAPYPGGIYHIAVWKKDNRIRLIIDGNLVIDAVDEIEIFGPPHGKGKIGLRQMAPSEAHYDKLEVRSTK